MAKKRTVEGQLIGSKLNDVKNTSRNRIQSLINQQRERYRNIDQYTNVDSQIEDIKNEECNIPIQQTENYDITAPEHSEQTPLPITKDESYDENTDNGIQKKNSTQIQYRYKILMDQRVYHKQPYIHISETLLLVTQHILYQGN